LSSYVTGIFIVEDAPGEVPDEIANMPEQLFLINHISLAVLSRIQSTFNSALMQVVHIFDI
jgi:hypothetical protein